MVSLMPFGNREQGRSFGDPSATRNVACLVRHSHAGLYEDILSVEESEANAARPARSKS